MVVMGQGRIRRRPGGAAEARPWDVAGEDGAVSVSDAGITDSVPGAKMLKYPPPILQYMGYKSNKIGA